jgi:hypothetical protein
MKLKPSLEHWRFRDGPYASDPGNDFGAFRIPGPCGRDLTVIASSGDEKSGVNWEHVSVSTRKHAPTWVEMDFIKRLFFDDEETVMQLHVPRSRWINNHETCLHLWRPTDQAIPLPPDITVGIKDLTPEQIHKAMR